MCTNLQWTCWEKYHKYYHQTGIFSQPHDKINLFACVKLNQSHPIVIKRNNLLSSKPSQTFIDNGDIQENDDDDIITGNQTFVNHLSNPIQNNLVLTDRSTECYQYCEHQ